MNPSTKLIIVAQDADDFEGLVVRARDLFNAGPVRLEKTTGGETMSYVASVLRSFEGDRETLVVTLEFDAVILKILARDLGGREALAAGEAAVLH